MKARWFNIPPKDPPPPPAPPVPEFIPPGRYELLVESIQERRSQYGNEYYALRCRILSPQVHEDFRVHFILSTVESAMWRMAEFLEAVTGERPVGQFLFKPDCYIGSVFFADIEIEYFRNQPRNAVKGLYFWNFGRGA